MPKEKGAKKAKAPEKGVAGVKKAIEKKPHEKKAPGAKNPKKVERSHLKRRAKYAALYEARPKKTHIGQDLLPRNHRDLTRYVRFPRYIRVQRQRKILSKRLKVPPPINQFSHTLVKARAQELFKFLKQYKPETSAQKRKRLIHLAKLKLQGKRKPTHQHSKAIKFGIHSVTSLIEKKRARLIVIAHDVDPIEIVLWLPALCRKMEVPYVIVKGKARLGRLVNRKNCAALAVTSVQAQHKETFAQLVAHAKEKFNDNADIRRKWGGGKLGRKSIAKRVKREKQIAAEQLVLKQNKEKTERK